MFVLFFAGCCVLMLVIFVFVVRFLVSGLFMNRGGFGFWWLYGDGLSGGGVGINLMFYVQIFVVCLA